MFCFSELTKHHLINLFFVSELDDSHPYISDDLSVTLLFVVNYSIFRNTEKKER